MQLAVLEPLLDDGDCRQRVLRIGEVDLDVVFGARLPWAIFGERMARAGDYAPAGGREALDRGMADAAAGPGQQQGAAWVVVVGRRHRCHRASIWCSRIQYGDSGIEPRLAP